MSAPSFVVYGVGAIGGVLAARLQLAGFPVTAVARGAHLQAIQNRGLSLVSDQGTETVPLKAVSSAVEIDWSTAPVVILAVKSHQTDEALDDLAADAPAETAIFTAQNGVANESAVLRRFANVYGVAVLQSAAHLEPGVVIQQSYPTAGILDIGRVPSGTDDVAESVSAALRGATFDSIVRPDIMAWKFRKLISNLGNGVTAAFEPGPDADELTERARAEAEAVLSKAGIDFVTREQDAERRGSFEFVKARPDYYGSTWQSVARGHSDVETDWFNGEIVLQARLLGTEAPVNELIARVTAEHARERRTPRSLDAASVLAGLDAR